jgi:hypothetical protein
LPCFIFLSLHPTHSIPSSAKAPAASKFTTAFELLFERYAQQRVCASAADSSISFGAAVLWERIKLKTSTSSSLSSPSSSSSTSSPSSLSLLSPDAALAAATATAWLASPPPSGFGLPPALVQWLIDTPFEVQKTDDELVAEAEVEAAALKQQASQARMLGAMMVTGWCLVVRGCPRVEAENP